MISVKKPQKARFLRPTSHLNYSNKGKEKEKKKERGEGKERRRRKKNGCTLSFFNSYFGVFGRKKLLDAKKGLFGDNGIKNPARCVYVLTQISRIKVLKSRSY